MSSLLWNKLCGKMIMMYCTKTTWYCFQLFVKHQKYDNFFISFSTLYIGIWDKTPVWLSLEHCFLYITIYGKIWIDIFAASLPQLAEVIVGFGSAQIRLNLSDIFCYRSLSLFGYKLGDWLLLQAWMNLLSWIS